ncbi:MAG: pseudoazurin [Bauldia sp.]|nr:pseudoazurin [Bauldia sp.]
MRSIFRAAGVAVTFLASTSVVSAAEHVVQMLNAGTDGIMVFEPGFVRASVGDTIRFVATNPGHFVQSVATPEGVPPWVGQFNTDFVVEVTLPGIYVYICPPHVAMGMLGVIQVDEPINLDAIQPALEELRTTVVVNPDRLDRYLGMIE